MAIGHEVYDGIILPDIDIENRGRYLVFISELHHNISESEGTWCKNRIHNYRLSSSFDGIHGQYFPLHEGTKVLVSFIENDYSNGEIIKIISDQYPDALPLNWSTINRDEMYQLIRTPKHNNIFLINEDTTTLGSDIKTPNSWHLYYDDMSIKIILNDDGLQIYNDENLAVTIEKNQDIIINGYSNIKIEKDSDIQINADSKIEIAQNSNTTINGQSHVEITQNLNVQASAGVNVKGGPGIHMDAGVIHLNSGTSVAPVIVPIIPTQGYETYPNIEKEITFDYETPLYGIIKTVNEGVTGE